jgi:hypothetical protein
MATLTATNPLLTRSVSDTLYNYSLSSAYRGQYVYDPSFALARTPDVWEIVRNDVSFSGSFERYCNNVTKPWHVEAPKKSKDDNDQRYAGIVEDALGQIFDFDTSRWVLSEAALLGRKYAFIESERRSISLDGNHEMDWIVPTFIKDIDRRRFRWVPTYDSKAVRTGTKLSFWNSISNEWQDVAPEFRSALIEYIWYNTEDRVGNGRGWLEPIYFAHYMKTGTIQKVADGIDRWAKGIWVVKLDGLRNASTGQTNEDLIAGAKTMIQTMRSDNIGVMENVDDIKVWESTGTGHEMGMSFIDYWDNGVERLVNGSTRPAGLGGQKTGARAQSETEEDTSEAHYQPARDRIDAVINRDLIGWFISQPLNRQNLQKLGLLEAKRPIYHTRQEKKLSIPDVVASASMFLDRGMPLIEGEVYERCGGWGVPGPNDKKTETVMAGGTPLDMMPGGKYYEKEKDAEKSEKKSEKFQEMVVAKFDELKMQRFQEQIADLKEAASKPQQPMIITATPEAAEAAMKQYALQNEQYIRLCEMQERAVKFMEGVNQELDRIKNSPVFNIHVPQQAAPVVNISQQAQEPPTVINNIEPSKVIVLDDDKKAKHINIKRGEDGKITGADITPK